MLASPSRRLPGTRIVSQVTSYVTSLGEGGGAKITSHASLVSSVRVRELSHFGVNRRIQIEYLFLRGQVLT